MEKKYFFLILFFLVTQNHGVIANGTEEYLQCNGSIAECQEQNEMLMPSEIARRLVEEDKYISYRALQGDQPACKGGSRGEAYSNSGCITSPAHPYHRGCSKIYGCQRDT